MIILYGIKNCDTVKKARRYLEQAGITIRFHDYRQDGLDEALLTQLTTALSWQQLLNTRGTTWRALSDEAKVDMTEQKAFNLMLAQPTLIKRPILVKEPHFLLGFSEASYQQFLTR